MALPRLAVRSEQLVQPGQQVLGSAAVVLVMLQEQVLALESQQQPLAEQPVQPQHRHLTRLLQAQVQVSALGQVQLEPETIAAEAVELVRAVVGSPAMLHRQDKVAHRSA